MIVFDAQLVNENLILIQNVNATTNPLPSEIEVK